MKFNLQSVGNKFKKIEPHHLVLLGVAIAICFLIFIKSFQDQNVNYSVNYNNDLPLEKQQKQNNIEAARLGDNDPNMRLANRVMEANAISLGILQFVIYKRVIENKTFLSVAELMDGFSASELKPPGTNIAVTLAAASEGRIITVRGLYIVRYQPNPLAIEVLSGGKTADDGAAFLLRAPDNASLAEAQKREVRATVWATLYVAPESKSAVIPGRFAPAGEYLNAKWSIEPMLVSELSGDKLQAIQKLLSEKN